MFNLFLEVIVGIDGDPMDEESYFLIKCVFLILKALLSIPLGVGKLLLFVNDFFFGSVFLVKGWEEIVVA